MRGEAIQLVITSAKNSVMRFGRYLCSRTVQGNIKTGTWGVNVKMDGSQRAKTNKRRKVAVTISRRNEHKYPMVNEV